MAQAQGTELLRAEDERELARRIEIGIVAQQVVDGVPLGVAATSEELQQLVVEGREAWQRFFLANLGLVGTLARRWSTRTGLDVEELFQEGCLGLAQALRRFDYRRGLRFSTLAWTYVQAAMSAAADRRCGALEGSPTLLREARETRRVRMQLEMSCGRPVSSAEVARQMDRPLPWVQDRLAVQRCMSLDGTEGRVFAVVESDLPELDWWPQLPLDHRRLLGARFGLDGGSGCTLAELAGRRGVSIATARRMEQRALARARELASRRAA